MSVVTRCGAVSLMLGLLLGAAPVLAQTKASETSGSSWTDPPVRGSAGPETPSTAKEIPGPVTPVEGKAGTTAPTDAAKPTQETASAPATTPAERAAASLGVKPVAASRRSEASNRSRRPVVRPRMVEKPMVISRRPARIVERPARRLAQQYRSGPVGSSRAFAAEPQSPYSPYRAYAATASNRRLAGWGGLIDEDRAGRTARAREAGYTVMRMRTYEYPDGTRVQRLTPFGGGGFGDLD
ncbi:hypothetical protein [Methylobacterium thuringiense]|uniref:Antifreeze protein n=1 Tax=Methylobacterium thuringiense TaxID=1003091 RepID=A0ABQ4TR84_9HYPH|nr:hypothetical protein [Methylobacterium thuringiense]GJE57126.1 hypothetical protein EKPJFOCH_3638 [Methylobacterium thuringiense]